MRGFATRRRLGGGTTGGLAVSLLRALLGGGLTKMAVNRRADCQAWNLCWGGVSFTFSLDSLWMAKRASAWQIERDGLLQ